MKIHGYGIEVIDVEQITVQTPGMGSWQQADIRLIDFLFPTATMQMRVLVADSAPGHLVEGGIDVFELVDIVIGGISDVPAFQVSVRPNPSNGQFEVRSTAINATARLLDATGREMMVPLHSQNGTWTINATHLNAGAYLLVIQEANGGRSVQRVVLQ